MMAALKNVAVLYPPAKPRLLVITKRSERRTGSCTVRSGWLTSCELSPKSATSSAILRVKASASVARLSALRKRLVAISSIVRVILRMFSTALRRLTIARALAIGSLPVASGSLNSADD